MINQIPNLLGTRKSYKRLNECPEQSVAFEKSFHSRSDPDDRAALR